MPAIHHPFTPMNALVIYDSVYGNTEKIAQAVAVGLGTDTKLMRIGEITSDSLTGLDVLVIGSPVHGGKSTEKLQALFKEIRQGSLDSVKVTAFDTRFQRSEQGVGLKMLMGVIGFAAEKMISQLVQKGGEKVIEPEGFIVQGTEGPLKEGEIERATAWGQEIRKRAES